MSSHACSAETRGSSSRHLSAVDGSVELLHAAIRPASMNAPTRRGAPIHRTVPGRTRRRQQVAGSAVRTTASRRSPTRPVGNDVSEREHSSASAPSAARREADGPDQREPETDTQERGGKCRTSSIVQDKAEAETRKGESNERQDHELLHDVHPAIAGTARWWSVSGGSPRTPDCEVLSERIGTATSVGGHEHQHVVGAVRRWRSDAVDQPLRLGQVRLPGNDLFSHAKRVTLEQSLPPDHPLRRPRGPPMSGAALSAGDRFARASPRPG